MGFCVDNPEITPKCRPSCSACSCQAHPIGAAHHDAHHDQHIQCQHTAASRKIKSHRHCLHTHNTTDCWAGPNIQQTVARSNRCAVGERGATVAPPAASSSAAQTTINKSNKQIQAQAYKHKPACVAAETHQWPPGDEAFVVLDTKLC
jgi:hypothetical protein